MTGSLITLADRIDEIRIMAMLADPPTNEEETLAFIDYIKTKVFEAIAADIAQRAAPEFMKKIGVKGRENKRKKQV